ncbi:class I SAM-dependent methyltransferase [Streptomyces sp. CNQ085]|uniref:class I SAM-dependent methyltransferase n=1 Tax=Streptomyces sp. CNQ085 TaxID=2886944 RepID=UPI001F504ADC|nr:class I SAM-dependent methyltransferase [Streptomyces sp. CNQ085]MCI0385686.1 methyltransferase domain-containing protein [Streptomyces sp. CNQ085]
MSAAVSREERYGDVLFASDRSREDDRLSGLAETFDPASRSVLLSLGLDSTWECLDVGAGTGTLSSWLAGMATGPGRVCAVDRDVRFLRRLPAKGLEIVEADITDPAFDPGRFDLVHARFVLMHLRRRDELLPRLASWVKPGGSLVLSDSLAVGGETSPHAPYRQTVRSLWRMLANTIGTDRHYAARYPQALTDIGLVEIGTDMHLPVVGLDAGFSRFLDLTLRQSRDNLLAGGLRPEVFDAALEHLGRPLARELFFAMVTAWGRKPVTPARDHRESGCSPNSVPTVPMSPKARRSGPSAFPDP